MKLTKTSKYNLFNFLKDLEISELTGKVSSHFPVMKDELLQFLKKKCIEESPHRFHCMLDTTFGTGAHSFYFLDQIPNLKISGIDMDERMIKSFETNQNLMDKSITSRIELQTGNFKDIDTIVKKFNFPNRNEEKQEMYDFVFADLGYNSLQLENTEYGLKYSEDGNLDMRFSQDLKITAKEILNSSDALTLQSILLNYGEEPKAKEIVKAIIERREKIPFSSNQELVELLNGIKGQSKPHKRVFQALRITVNNELSNLQKLLEKIPQVLKPLGFAFFLTFHSLEQGIILKGMRRNFHMVSKQFPSEIELKENLRSKSATLTILQKK